MRELKDRQRGPYVRGVDSRHPGQRRFDQGQFVTEGGQFGVERRFVDRPRQERVQEPVVHCGQLAPAFRLGDPLVALQVGDIGERRLERRAEPLGHFVVGHLELREVGDDRVFKVITAPANRRVIFIGIVVRAPVVIVRSHAAALQLSFDSLAGDERSAVLADEESTRQRHVDLRLRPAVLSAQYILAGLERGPVDQRLVTALVVVLTASNLADVEPVVEDVRHGRPVEPGVRLLVREPFVGQRLAQRFERVPTRRVEFE